MRKIRDVLRLKFEAGLSDRQIAAAVGSARSTEQERLRRCRERGIGWPLSPDLDEPQLLARLYRRVAPLAVVARPDFPTVHRELMRAGVTRQLLWEEYKAAHPEGLQYTAFCVHYQRWLTTQELVLRQDHAPGDKLFVDYAGQTVPIIDGHTGEARAAQEVRLTASAVEIFHERALIATHPRARERALRSTRAGHRPAKHIAVIEQSLTRVLEQAVAIGPATHAVLCTQASRKLHPEETLRSAQGILRLAHDFSAAALERACERALALRSFSYRAVRALIDTPSTDPAQPALDLVHENVRGPEYFQ
ncbi:MAG: hypothetical protein ACRETX_03290 [Steroidobacteraceae bacterium]